MNTSIKLAFLLFISNFSAKTQTVEWVREFNTYSSGESIIQTEAGDFKIGGMLDDNPMVACFDPSGTELWKEQICTCGYVIRDLRELKDHRIVSIDLFGSIIIIRPDSKVDTVIHIQESSGRAYHEKNLLLIPGSGSIQGQPVSIMTWFDLNTGTILTQQFDTINTHPLYVHQFPDSSLLIHYYQFQFQQPILVKKDAKGVTLWQKSYYLKEGFIRDMLVDEDGSIFLAGFQHDTIKGNFINAVLIKLDSLGQVLWRKDFTSSKGIYSAKIFNRIKKFGTPQIYLAGSDGYNGGGNSEVAVTCIDNEGNIIWELKERVDKDGNEANDLILDIDQNLIVVGTAANTDVKGYDRAFLMKIRNPLTDVSVETQDDVNIFPNPATNQINIHLPGDLEKTEILIFNLVGQTVYQSIGKSEIDLGHFAPGQYFVTLKSKIFNSTKKLSIIRD